MFCSNKSLHLSEIALLVALLHILNCSSYESEPIAKKKVVPIQESKIEEKKLPEEKKELASPSQPTPLEVEGFEPASHVGPDENTAEPMPVTVVLHGNYDRPEWECETWKAVAGFYGWVLCPRGVPAPDVEGKEDRWTYRGSGVAQKEIEAGIRALKERYPGKVSEDGKVLAGFSLGANYIPWLVIARPSEYKYLFMVEGGLDRMDKNMRMEFKKAGIRGVGMAMGVNSKRKPTMKLVKQLNKLGVLSVYVDMKGAGHGYSGDFEEMGQIALKQLVASN